MNAPLLSLCMIVRDSAATLGACLESIRESVDEIIVVDTGSIDNTREIAHSFGAKIHDFHWIDDFSAARNESLRHARGQWILWMDADDTIDTINAQKLRLLALREHPTNVFGYIIQVHCPAPAERGDEQLTVVDHVKLIRNDPLIRFEGRIHEQLLMSIRRAGRDIEWTDIHVVHSGVDHSALAKQRKIDRDLRILKLDLIDRPNHPFVLFNLGMTCHEAENHPDAIYWLDRSLRFSHPSESHVRKAYALLVGSLGTSGRLAEARSKCVEGLEAYPFDPELLFRQGIVLQKLGQWEEAKQSYLRALDDRETRHFASIDQGVRVYKARHNLALVLTELGRDDLAEIQWRSIVAKIPAYRDGWSNLGSTLLRQKKYLAFEEIIESLRAHPRLEDERNYLAVEFAIAKGDFTSASQVLKTIAISPGNETRHLRLRSHCLFEIGTLAEAQAALEELLVREPNCPMSLHNLGVVLFRQGSLQPAAEVLRRSLALRPAAMHSIAQLQVIERTVSEQAQLNEEHVRGKPVAVGPTAADVPQSRANCFEWVSLGKLAAATRELAGRLPHNVAGIVGIPRSGMIPASIMSTLLQVPLYELAQDGAIRQLGHGCRGHALGWAGSEDGPLVIVDDTVYGGGSMAHVRQLTAPLQERLIYAAIYARPEAAHVVDVYARLLPSPHLLEWNFFNSGVFVGVSIDPVLWGGAALDFDGILCHDPTVCDADDEEGVRAYVAWMREATPRWLPRRLPIRCIITARLERWRPETEAWLRKYGVSWQQLIMHPADHMSHRNSSDVAAWKAQALRDSGCRWFVESDVRQAERIHQLSGCKVICPDAEWVFH